MLHGIGGGVGHGRLQNKKEISHLRVAVVVKNQHSELKIVGRRQRPPSSLFKITASCAHITAASQRR